MDSVQSQDHTSLHILNFPNEILFRIFDFLRSEPVRSIAVGGAFGYRNGKDDVKNTRLVCRRFRDASSHLLISSINVSVNKASLAQLDEISRHPLMSKGVRKVNVSLRFFDASSANYFEDVYCYNQLRRLTSIISLYRTRKESLLRTLSEAAQGLQEDINIPKVNSQLKIQIEIVATGGRILESWRKLTDHAPDTDLDDEDRANIEYLQRAHKRYRDAYLEQEQLLSDGSFAQEVANAVARMPIAKSLFVTHESLSNRVLNILAPETGGMPGFLVTDMATPMDWVTAHLHDITIPTIELLVQIPLAIYRAGSMVTNVHYKLALPPEFPFSRLIGSDQDMSELNAAMQELKDFTFESMDIRTHLRSVPTMAESKQIKKFVEAFTDTDSIETLYMNCSDPFHLLGSPSCSAGSLLLTRKWPRLRQVCFQGPLEPEDIKQFFANTQGRASLDLYSNHLLSGSWTEVLDIIRDNVQRTGITSFVQLPSGSEWEQLAPEQRTAVFGGGRWHSKANLYIQGLIPENPLKGLGENNHWGMVQVLE